MITTERKYRLNPDFERILCFLVVAFCAMTVFAVPFDLSKRDTVATVMQQPSMEKDKPHAKLVFDTIPHEDVRASQLLLTRDSVVVAQIDTIPLAAVPGGEIMLVDSMPIDTSMIALRSFNPDPNRAVWLSALFPGLGQVYNRRFWKLPLVVGGFFGVTYALTWNGRMLSDYTLAYRDAMDNDPNTKSYLDFFASTVKEEDLDMVWLQKTLKARKDFYRRNRDLSIICLVGMYLLCMIDAYVDASLSHFDISPDLSMNVAPAVICPGRDRSPALGLMWALRF